MGSYSSKKGIMQIRISSLKIFWKSAKKLREKRAKLGGFTVCGEHGTRGSGFSPWGDFRCLGSCEAGISFFLLLICWLSLEKIDH